MDSRISSTSTSSRRHPTDPRLYTPDVHENKLSMKKTNFGRGCYEYYFPGAR